MKNFSRRTAWCILLIWLLSCPVSAASTLIPGGQLVGLALQDDTVTISAFDETLGAAAKAAGLASGDRILRINKTEIRSAADVRQALHETDDTVDITIIRNGKVKSVKLRPPLTEDGPRLGVYLKQGATGVGTVTYYDPSNGKFGALGHGVNTSGGSLLQLREGSAYPAAVASVKKGKVGTPGQLMGILSSDSPYGSVRKNTAQGIFGTAELPIRTEALPVAQPEEVKTGAATIRSTVCDRGICEYSVEILKIYPNADDRCRNMLLKVTDPTLLETTGGIVQGMSGSPVIQNGKLVGAVTHVLVNDPTRGYAIFIENMLETANQVAEEQAKKDAS